MKKLKKQLRIESVDETTLDETRKFITSTAVLFDSVLDECGIDDEERVVYREMLARYAEANLVAAMWKGLGKEHFEHFSQFMEQSFVISPEKDHVAILIDFTCLYPDLREKAYAALDKFFGEFVEDVRRVKGIVEFVLR
jgi:hypothetical protein